MIIKTVVGDERANELLSEGWQLLQVVDGGFVLAQADEAEEALASRRDLIEILENIDPDEVDRLALQQMGLGDRGGTAAVIQVIKEMLLGATVS